MPVKLLENIYLLSVSLGLVSHTTVRTFACHIYIGVDQAVAEHLEKLGQIMHWQLPLALPHGIAQLVHGRNALLVIDIVQANKQVGVFKHGLLVGGFPVS